MIKTAIPFNRLFILCVLFCVSLVVSAQDSIDINVSDYGLSTEKLSEIENFSSHCAPTHRLKPLQVAVPVAVVGLGAFMINNGWGEHLREEAQKGLSAEGKHHTKMDEVLQFAPTVTCLGLSLCGIKGEHRFSERLFINVLASVISVATTEGLKFICKENRPDGSNEKSFPSGHTARAFQGAEILYQEYKHVNSWLAYSGYAMAALTGYLRIYNDKHYINDVVAGAAIGILSAKLAYWLYPKIFTRSRCSRNVEIVGIPYYNGTNVGLNVAISF